MTTHGTDGSGEARLVLAFSQHVVRMQGLLEQAIAPTLAAQGHTAAELDVLGSLRSAGDPYQLRPKELVARLLLTTGGLSNVLRRLEARGLIARVPDPADGRGHHVRLTPAGVVAARAVTEAAASALQRLLFAVPAPALEDALHGLRSVLSVVDPAPLTARLPAGDGEFREEGRRQP